MNIENKKVLFDLSYASGKGDLDATIEIATLEELLTLAKKEDILIGMWNSKASDGTIGGITIADDYLY